MAVLRRMPNTIMRQIVSEGYKDEKGDWHEGEKSWSEPMLCDAVPAGKANVITYEDGSTATYTFTVYMNPGDYGFKLGDTVSLNRYGHEYILTVKGVHPYQHQYKLWV